MKRMQLPHGVLLQLKRWNTPAVYNGWEQITRRDRTKECFNIEEVCDFIPQMGPMIGYAVTVVCEPSNPDHADNNPHAWEEYRAYVAEMPDPKIVVVQDLDKPKVIGSFWGEVNANVHKALGCVGTITDGAIRDLDEMTDAGFKALARRLCVGHAFVTPVRWNCEVEVFGRKIQPGQLVHADKHGFMAIPEEDEQALFEAITFMDANECLTKISAARNSCGKAKEEILEAINTANRNFKQAALEKYGRAGEG